MSKRRPNRSHSAIDHLPPEIQLQIKDWHLDPTTTYEWIAQQLQDMGHKISQSQVHRWIAKRRDEIERMEAAKTQAEIILKHIVPEGAEVEQAAVALAGAICLEALQDAEIQKIQSIGDLAKVANSLGRLQTSSVMRDKWETEKRKKIDAAVQELEMKIQDVLDGKPDLIKAILEAVDEAKQQMTEKSA